MRRSVPILLKLTATIAAALVFSGCAMLNPDPLEQSAIHERAGSDRVAMFEGQEPITAPISLNEAMARAVKYNLDLRLKKMESAVNGQLHEVSKFDLLPNFLVSAGYSGRSNYSGGDSRPLYGAQGSQPANAMARTQSFSTSADMNHRIASAEFSWNLLDFGVSYYRAKQRADEFLIAEERRRRVVQTIIHDVRFAYHRAVAAQKLASEAEAVLGQARAAIDLSERAEKSGAIPVQVALAYRRSLIDAVALLNIRRQELDFAKAELAALMSTPTTQFTLVNVSERALRPMPSNLAVLEDAALRNRPELREEDYRKRISGNETRRQLMQALPNLTLGIGQSYDSNSLLYNSNWIEGSTRAVWNLLRVASAPSVIKAGERQLDADDARRQSLAMAIVTQTRIAVLRYGLAMNDLELADKSADVDLRSALVAKSGVVNQAEAELELVRANARATMSKYIRAIAYANAQAAYARIQHSLGQDLDLGDIEKQSVAELAKSIGASLAKAEGNLSGSTSVRAQARTRIHLQVEDDPTVRVMAEGMKQALKSAGFDLVDRAQAGIVSVKINLKLDGPQRGLRRGEVVLEPLGRPGSTYAAVLPENARPGTYVALGEAAIMANVGNLRLWARK